MNGFTAEFTDLWLFLQNKLGLIRIFPRCGPAAMGAEGIGDLTQANQGDIGGSRFEKKVQKLEFFDQEGIEVLRKLDLIRQGLKDIVFLPGADLPGHLQGIIHILFILGRGGAAILAHLGTGQENGGQNLDPLIRRLASVHRGKGLPRPFIHTAGMIGDLILKLGQGHARIQLIGHGCSAHAQAIQKEHEW